MANRRQYKKKISTLSAKEFKEYFRKTYGALFMEMYRYGKESISNGKLNGDDVHKYLDEVMHSMLFLGQINTPIINPEEIPILETFRRHSANPDAFKSHVPRTTPYSILLEMVVRAEGPENSDTIKNTLEGLARRSLHPYSPTMPKLPFFATVVAKSYFCDENQGEDRLSATSTPFWGASLSCSGKEASQIMMDLNCLFNWHPLIAQAVTFAQSNPNEGGILEFPPTVISEAYKHNDVDLKLNDCPPCSKCQTVFVGCTFKPRANTMHRARWEFGNCAENEAISNLLKGLRRISAQVKKGHPQATNHWGKMRLNRIFDVKQRLNERKWPGDLQIFIPSDARRPLVNQSSC